MEKFIFVSIIRKKILVVSVEVLLFVFTVEENNTAEIVEVLRYVFIIDKNIIVWIVAEKEFVSIRSLDGDARFANLSRRRLEIRIYKNIFVY